MQAGAGETVKPGQFQNRQIIGIRVRILIRSGLAGGRGVRDFAEKSRFFAVVNWRRNWPLLKVRFTNSGKEDGFAGCLLQRTGDRP
jgi:hypothetical protein